MLLLVIFIGIIGVFVYYTVVYYRFEAQVEREQIVRRELADKVMLKTRIAAIIGGICMSVIIPPELNSEYWLLYYPFILTGCIVFSLFVLGTSTRRGIERLEMKYGQE